MKTYCFKLYKAKRNKKLHKVINIAGIIYNHCIALHKRYYRLFKKSLNIYKLQKHLTKLKKIGKFSYFKEVGSQAIQDITQRIDRACKLFFRNLKHKIRTAPPSFKKIRKYKSFTLKQAGWKLLKDILRYFHEKKIHVPQDISLAGFGGYPVGSISYPSLTSLAFDYKHLGIKTAEKLLSMLQNQPVTSEYDHNMNLIIRESTRLAKI